MREIQFVGGAIEEWCGLIFEQRLNFGLDRTKNQQPTGDLRGISRQGVDVVLQCAWEVAEPVPVEILEFIKSDHIAGPCKIGDSFDELREAPGANKPAWVDPAGVHRVYAGRKDSWGARIRELEVE